MVSFCCEFCGKPHASAQRNIQHFILEIYYKANDLANLMKTFKKFEIREKSCSEEVRVKIAQEREVFNSALKEALSAFNGFFDDPYFKKVEIYHSEVAKTLIHLKLKTNSNREIVALKKSLKI